MNRLPRENGALDRSLQSLSKSQIESVRRIPRHEEATVEPIDARRPVSIYFDDNRFKLEQSKIFRSTPVPIVPASLLREPGTMLAHDGYGVPLILARGRDGKVRAFFNVCTHKGMRLLDGCQEGNRLTCPYHAWTFSVEGELVAVAREDTFLNLDKKKLNLTEIPCHEAGGLIWVILDRNARADFSALTKELIEDFDCLALGDSYVYGRKTFHLKANWKLVLEPFLEGYHVKRLHARTVGPMFADNPTATTRLGPHIRSVSGRIDFRPEDLETAKNVHKIVTLAYRIFPNAVLITSPYYTSLMIIMPTSISTSTVEYYMLTPEEPVTEAAKDICARSLELILKVFGEEDFWAAESTQVGLASGAIDEVHYSALEDKIPLYYEVLDSYLTRPE